MNLNLFRLPIIILFFLSFDICFAQGEFHGSVSMPVYNGGFSSLNEFITQNIKYRGKSGKEGVPAVVTLSYIINENGNIENVKVLRGINAMCDSEAVRVAQLITGWQPAVQWGKPISIKVVMPVEFYLETNSQNEQTITITGKVVDNSNGKPIEGTLILVKGTSEGAITGKDGLYTLPVPGEEYELEFSSLGYENRSEKIGKNRTINVEMPTKQLVIDFNAN